MSLRLVVLASSVLLMSSPGYGACTQAGAGSGVFTCSGSETSTQSVSPPAGQALNVTADSTFAVDTSASGTGLSLSNSAGDGAIIYSDDAATSIIAEDDGVFVSQAATGATSITINGSILSGPNSTTDDAIDINGVGSSVSDITLTTGAGIINARRGEAIDIDHDGSGCGGIDGGGACQLDR